MRGLVAAVCLVLAPVAAWAQADVSASAEPGPSDEAPAQGVVYGAMPGGIHAPSAEVLPRGVIEVSMLSGYGYRKGLLGPDEHFDRALGDIAFAYAPTDLLTLALSFDGRYDVHYGIPVSGDDGLVGDPHLFARLAKAVGAARIGAQLDIWFPGAKAPSITGSATSVDARLLGGFAVGPGTLSLDVGFRLDNSIKSAGEYGKLSLQDRVSLGVSDYDEVMAGALLAFPAGKAWLGVEGTLEAFVGSPTNAGDATLREGSLLVRGGVTAGFHVTPVWSLAAYVEVAKVPGIELAQIMANSIPIIPYEPVVTAGLGLEARFGGPHRASPIAEKDCHKHVPPDCPAVKVPLTADITGSVVDDAGKPVVAAKVAVTLKNSSVAPVTTDDKGNYAFKGVPIGTSIDGRPSLEETGVELAVTVDGKKPGSASIAQVAPGDNVVPPIKLEPLVQPAKLKGIVRARATGKPVPAATITLDPGDKKLEPDRDGSFAIELPPGQYKITVTAKGFATQELEISLAPNDVAIKNIDLSK
ncbi:MAG TPA: carboxypeptidase-like regulatory domain-containing protein [Kofleriaceae bacterium]|nr:carboxypeptidase-like regulatory domain-containing protein [Kofleriaceae bacterium]